jgi:hypothetical protein
LRCDSIFETFEPESLGVSFHSVGLNHSGDCRLTCNQRNSEAAGASTLAFFSPLRILHPTPAPLQRRTGFLIPSATIFQHVAAITYNKAFRGGVDFAPDAILAIQTAAEDHIVKIFQVRTIT